jgi:thiamine biosynthesis lipoprotein
MTKTQPFNAATSTNLVLFWAAICTTALLHLTACRAPEPSRLAGKTMGTTWSIVIADSTGPNQIEQLRSKIDMRLHAINTALSTWDSASEISRFNKSAASKWHEISSDFYQVLEKALGLAKSTGGAFDPTIAPLINAWGFGPDSPGKQPSNNVLKTLRESIGYNHIRIKPGFAWKSHEDTQLDLSAIAKGYGVDALILLLTENGVQNASVEIGGDVRVIGSKPGGKPWQVGIEMPTNPLEPNRLASAIALSNMAIATSGSYRNFIRTKQGKVHHIMDPRTGAPVRSNLVSATITAPTCMAADGIATALMVLGEKEGLRWIKSLKNVEAYLILSDEKTGFRTIQSPGFDKK